MFDEQHHNPLRREVPGHLFSFQETIFGMTLPQLLSDMGGGVFLFSATSGLPLVPRLVVCLLAGITLLVLVHARVQGYPMLFWLYLMARFLGVTKRTVWRSIGEPRAKGALSGIQRTWFHLDSLEHGVMCSRVQRKNHTEVCYWVAFTVETVQHISFLPEAEQVRFYARIKSFLDGLGFPLKFLSQVASVDPAHDPGMLAHAQAETDLAGFPHLQQLQRAILATQRQQIQHCTITSHFILLSASSQEVASARLVNVFRSPLRSLFSLLKTRHEQPVTPAQVMDELRIRASLLTKLLATLDVRATLLSDRAMLHTFASFFAPGAALPSFAIEVEETPHTPVAETEHAHTNEEREGDRPKPEHPPLRAPAQTKAARRRWHKRIRGLHRSFLFQSTNPHKRFEQGVLALADLLAPTAIDIGRDAIAIDVHGKKRWARYFEVTGYGSDLVCGWQEELTSLGLPMCLATKCEPLDSAMMIGKLESHLTKLESSRLSDAKHHRRSKTDQKIGAEQVLTMMEALARKKLKVFAVQMVIGIHAGSKERLEQRSEYLRSHLRDLQLTARALSRRHDVAWQYTLPTCIDTGLDFFTNLPSDVLATFANWSTGCVGTLTGAYLGTTGSNVSKQLVRLNPWDPHKRLPNPHITICGESGMGKSWVLKHILLGWLGSRLADAVVMDRDGDYDAIHAFLGPAESQRFNLAGTIPFNLFDLPYGLADVNGDEKSDLLAEFIDNHLLTGLSFVYNDAFSKPQEALLTSAARKTYAARGITMEAIWDDPQTILREPPTFRDFLDTLKTITAPSEAVRQSLVEHFTHVAYLLPGHTSVALGKPLTIFNIHDLDEKWYPLLFYVIHHFLMRHRALKRDERYLAYVIEEASFFLAHPNGKRAMEVAARGGRKYGISLIVASQDPDDFVREGHIILANSATHLFLGMQHQTAHTLGLAQEYERILEEATPGRAVMRCGREYAALDVTRGSPLHQMLLTTDPVEQRRLREQQQHPSDDADDAAST